MIKPIRFSEHLIMDGYVYAYSIAAADIDGDGDLDVVSADTKKGLYWFENNGRGKFVRHVIYVGERLEYLERLAVADINGDGYPDIVIVDNINGDLMWFENNGTPIDEHLWKRHFITKKTGVRCKHCGQPQPELPSIYDVAVADLDGDSDLDVAASSYRHGNQFAWFENKKGEWIKHIIEENLVETRTIRTADFNNDGKIDLLGTATATGQVIWYENSGDPAHEPWKKHIIDTAPRPTHGNPVDVDGDGDIDVVMALGMAGPHDQLDTHEIVWYENNGKPEKEDWKKHVISKRFVDAFEAIGADIDGDGNIEVVATAWGPSGKIALFKHEGDPKGPWTMQVLKEDWPNANQVIVADLNGDGRLDIIAVAENGSNELRWWRNEG